MSVDLNALQLEDELIEVTEGESYPDPQEFPPPIPDGTYLLVSGEPDFSPTEKPQADGSPQKFLKANLKHEIVEGDFAGRVITDFGLSNKTFTRKGPGGAEFKVSQMSDHLRATGDRATYRTHQEYADALQAATGKPFRAKTQWVARAKEIKTKGKDGRLYAATVRGMKKFPFVNGAYVPEVEITDPETGAKETCKAFATISFRLPA